MTPPTKIALIGFMGSGKTTTAARLAPMLGTALYEMDTLIVNASGLDSIPTIFERLGEPRFRQLETSVAETLSTLREGVISTGGGVISNPLNLQHLRANGGVIIYLKASFETVSSRVGDLSTRPLFKEPARAAELYRARAPLYEAAADLVVSTDGLTEDSVAQQVHHLLRGAL